MNVAFAVYYMVCECIDVSARVNYFSRNNEPRYRLRNPCATGYASKVNIMHPSLRLLPYRSHPRALSLSLFLYSRHFRARQREDLSRGEARQNLTPILSATADASPSLQKRYKRVRARAIRQRCNAVPRVPLSRRGGFCVSSILCHRSVRFALCNSKSEKKIQGGTYI